MNNKEIPFFVSGLILVAGVICFVFAVYFNYQIQANTDGSGCAALGFLLILLALICFRPDLLRGPNNYDFSTMRLAVLMIVLLFGMLTLKSGWNAKSLAELKLDESWIYLIGFAFGGKALQSFAEAFHRKHTNPVTNVPKEPKTEEEAPAEKDSI